MIACRMGHLECAQALIDAGAAVDKMHYHGRTALIIACEWGYLECAHALIDAGAAVDKVGNRGATALMVACREGQHECAQALIIAGAAVDKVNAHGSTALTLACEGGHYDCTRALIDAQADPELMDRFGRNALMIACESPPSYLSQSKRQGRIRCALALLAATAPIREADVRDRMLSLKLACKRLQFIEVALAVKHAIEDAPPLANVGALQTDAQGIVVNFARDMLARAKPRRPSLRLAAKC